ncbi:MAG: glycosyltransferase family 4 protein [Pseudanabaena sp. ELA607]
MTKNYPTIHIWTPNIFNVKGGIQVFSDFLVKGLQQVLPQAKYAVFSKHDVASAVDLPYLEGTNFYGVGEFHGNLKTVMFIKLLLNKAWQEKPQLIITTHVHFAVMGLILQRLWGIPYWIIAHGVEVWDLKSPLMISALKNADQILAVSEYTRQRLIKEQNIAANKIKILYNTFNSDNFYIVPKKTHLLNKYNIKPDAKILLTVARLFASEQYKGYDSMLHTLPQLRQEIPNVHYILVGKGSDLERLQNLVKQLDLADCVTLTGFIPDAELADYYNLCDLFVMPSKREGFGIVYLEAMACGKPALGGNQDGALDALGYGELGILVNPDDHDMIIEQMIHFFNKTYPLPIIYQPETLRKAVIKKFGFEQYCQQIRNHLMTQFPNIFN